MKYRYLLSAFLLGCFYQSQAYAWGNNVADKIYAAARRGDQATISYYIHNGYPIDSSGSNGVTALCLAYYDKSWQAYDLLLRYGANSNSECMYKRPSRVGKYLLGGAIVAGVAGGIAIAAGGGGGGGGSDNNSGSNSSNNNSDNGSGNSDSGDNGSGNNGSGDNGSGNNDSGDNGSGNNGSGNNDSGDNGSGNNDSGNNGDDAGEDNSEPVYYNIDEDHADNIRMRMSSYLDSTGYTSSDSSSFHYYTRDDFRNNAEYNGGYFLEHTSAGVTYKTVNFLDSIQAATAYSKFYGYDDNNNLVNRLGKDVVVGVIDTGVKADHKEFADSSYENGSKVFGHNFDYGPCNGEKKNCWNITSSCVGSLCHFQKRELYDANGEKIMVDTRSGYFSEGEGVLDQWADKYPSDYKWEEHKDDPTPLTGTDPLTGSSYTHGTHVAGIIAANWNRSQSGMMGVAFTNTQIDAVRWDFTSTIYDPIKVLVDDNVYAINMSLGRNATANNNASLIKKRKNSLFFGYLSAAAYTVRNYETVAYKDYTAYKGPIWVKAAGNEGYAEPDLESGIKNLGKQTVDGRSVDLGKLMMLVVVSADVTFNNDGTVASYKKSSFSNSCGSTAKYCIAAPGGDTATNMRSDLYSSTDSSYLGMHGTSQATPVVTGSLAFLQAAYPFLHSSEVLEILLETANTNGEGYNHSNEHQDLTYGAGLLDLGKAVTYYLSPVIGTNSVMTVSGDNVTSPSVRLDNASLEVTSIIADAFEDAVPDTVTAFDRYMRPFEFPTSNYISVTHSGYKALKNDVNHIAPNQKMHRETQGNMRFAYAEGPLNGNGLGFVDAEYDFDGSSAGFFFSENTRYNNTAALGSELVNPFMSFNSAYGAHYNQQINSDWSWKFEAVGGENGLYDGDYDYRDSKFINQAYGFNAEVEFKPRRNLSLVFSSGLLHEDEALLGTNGEGAFAVPESQTYHTGIRAAWKTTPRLTLSGSYFVGFTKAQDFASTMLSTSDLISDSFAFDANYKYNKTTDFGFRLSSPLKVEHGKLYVDFASGRDYYSDEVYRNHYAADLKSKKREYKLAWYLNKLLTDNLSISSEFDVRFNPEHRSARNDYRALFGLSWNF